MLLVAATTALVVVAFAVPLAVLIRHNVYQDAVTALEKQANAIGLYLNQQPTDLELTAYLTDDIDTKYRAAVTLPDLRTIGRIPPGNLDAAPVPNGGDHAPGDRDHGPPTPPRAVTVAWQGGRLTRIQAGPYLVQVWAPDGALRDGEGGWFLLLALASLGLLLVGVAGA